MTRTFCVVMADNTSYTLQAATVFEVAAEIGDSQKAIEKAMHEKHPFSLRVPWGWVTQNAHRLPVAVAGVSFRRVTDPYNTLHTILSS